MEIREFLETMMEREASDVYLTVHSTPMYRIDGVVQPIGGRYRLYYPLMYPGFALEPLDATLSIRFDKPMLGSKAEPFHRLGIVLLHALALVVAESEVELRLSHVPGGQNPEVLV